MDVGYWCCQVSRCLSIYRFDNGLLGFLPPVVVFLKMKLGVQWSCDGKDKASFQGSVFSYSALNYPAITWVLRHLVSGVRGSTIFHLASNFSFFKVVAGRTKWGKAERKTYWTQETKVARFWYWWFMKGFDEEGRKWVVKEVKEILIRFRLKCIGVTCRIAENLNQQSGDC